MANFQVHKTIRQNGGNGNGDSRGGMGGYTNGAKRENGGGKIVIPDMTRPKDGREILPVKENGTSGGGLDLKAYFNTVLSDPKKAFKDQPVVTVILLAVLLKLLKVW